ncbi:MAG: hypothetical protein JST84_11455 [Acidobacteria bacterium]|nr:hypothetical protein [Acidobacteriota bacterium]
MEKNFAKEEIEKMSDEDRKKLILSLGRYADNQRRFYYWYTMDPEALPKGHTPASIVGLALETVLRGKTWQWQPDKVPDLKRHLMNFIDDCLRKLSINRENKLLKPEPTETEDEQYNREFICWQSGSDKRDPKSDWLARQQTTPEELLLEKERQAQIKHAMSILLNLSKDDPILLKVIAAKLEGYEKSSEIAERIEVEVKEVYKATKRFDRKVAEVDRKLKEIEAAKTSEAPANLEKEGRNERIQKRNAQIGEGRPATTQRTE